MRISDVIIKLQRIEDKYGDINVDDINEIDFDECLEKIIIKKQNEKNTKKRNYQSIIKNTIKKIKKEF